MSEGIEEAVGSALSRWVHAVAARPALVLTACALITVLAAGYAVLELRINSDNVQLVREELRANHVAFAEIFPNLENALLIVVDAKTPELAREASAALEARLKPNRTLFEDVYLPGGDGFFERYGLLYRTEDELETFAEQLAAVQPIIAELERDASVANLASLVKRGIENAGTRDEEQWPRVLESVGHATVQVYSEFPLAISWEELLLQDSAVDQARRRVLIAHPILDFDDVLAAQAPLAFIRESAAALGLTPERGVTVRVTGNPALNYEEMIGLAWDIGLGGVVTFFLVAALLLVALRAPSLVIVSVVTLLAGLIWAAAGAALLVGHLNVISLSFGVLFIGLGVDFAIHMGMRYADLRRAGHEHLEALDETSRSVGPSLALCTITTATGFLVFVPTDYLGVAELGLIAGFGMFIVFFLTMTLWPALLTRGCPMRRPPRSALRFQAGTGGHGLSSSLILGIAGVLGVVALATATQVRFDSNVIEMRDPRTESVQTFNDLLAQSGTASPWYADVVAKDLASAQAVAERMKALPEVDSALTLADYVPADQEGKREILEELAFLMESTGADSGHAADLTLDEQVDALRGLHHFLDERWLAESTTPLGGSMRMLRDRIGEFLERVERDPDPGPAIEKLRTVLLSTFPQQVERLREALDPPPLTLADLPEELVSRMLAADGRARVQVFPSETLGDEGSFERFTNAVTTVAPTAAGIPINLAAFARATRSSFREALSSAFVLISLLILALWRRISDWLFVMAPLVLSGLMTASAMVVLDIPFNFANVVVLPLLLGIGVDSGIHLVHRSRVQNVDEDAAASLMSTTTARAVFYSALTTLLSFGSLSFSGHRGVASLGVVLSIGMVLTIASNLVVLPALLEWRLERNARRAAAAK